MIKKRTLFGLLASLLLMGASRSAASGQAHTIFQAFNLRFSEVESDLRRLKNLGFDAVLISPPQKSIDRDEWWARYQPVDYRVLESPLGNRDDLRALFARADELGVKILVDLVLNHMADHRYFSDLDYPQFLAHDFHDPHERRCISNFADRWQATNFWLCDRRSQLPDLNTSSSYVREIHLNYIEDLLDLGADGFRFDAAVNIETDYFAWLMARLPRDKMYYGEVIGTHEGEAAAYTPYFPITDFFLLGDMISAFTIGGDLRDLKNPTPFLNQSDTVWFVRNHDAFFNDGFFRFYDEQDARLAYAYVLAQSAGYSFVYSDDVEIPEVRTALAWRHQTRSHQLEYDHGDEICPTGAQLGNRHLRSCENDNLLFMRRSSKGFVWINKSSAWLTIPTFWSPHLRPGCYRELRYNFEACFTESAGGVSLTSWDSAEQARIGPRTALFFTR